MHIEQLDIIDFLSTSEPLRALPRETVAQLATHAQTAYHRANHTILVAGKPNTEIYLIRKDAVYVKDLNGKIDQQLDLGSWFGHSAQFNHNVMQQTIKSREDYLLYVFPLHAI